MLAGVGNLFGIEPRKEGERMPAQAAQAAHGHDMVRSGGARIPMSDGRSS